MKEDKRMEELKLEENYNDSKAYILPEQPGVVRFTHDLMTGILCGRMAKEIVKRWNTRPTPPIGIKLPEKKYPELHDTCTVEYACGYNQSCDDHQQALSQAHLSRTVDEGKGDNLEN